MPAICREPAAKPVDAECQASSSRLIALPLRGRSRDKPRSYGLRPESKAADLLNALLSRAQSCQAPSCFCPQGVGARLPAICREPAAEPMDAVCQVNRVAGFCYRCAVDRGQGGTPPRSLLRPPARIKSRRPPQCASVQSAIMSGTVLLLPAGRRSALARDLPGTGSRTDGCCVSGKPSRRILLPMRGRSRARWNATPVAPTASGQNQKPQTSSMRFCPERNHVRHRLASARRA